MKGATLANYVEMTDFIKDDKGNISPVVNELTQRFSKLSPNSNEQHQNTDLQMDSKSRLQLLAPPPLTGLPTSDGNSPTSGDSIVSPELSNTENLLCDSSLVGSRWFAHSNGLDALLNSKSITYNNDPFRFDDDLPSLFAKQVSKFPTSSMVGNLKLALSQIL